MSVNKKLYQHDLRKAMHDIKKKSGNTKKIESPLAKYTEAGQLTCIVCKTIIRNETAWVVHLNSKTHKENIAQTKKVLERKDNINKSKRPLSPKSENEPNKKVKGILKNSCHTPTELLSTDVLDKSTVTKVFENLITPNIDNDNKSASADVLDNKVADVSVSTSLPEGFFDDPILDAKVRNVEYKDPIEEEWDKFVKEIKEETAQSAQIIAEDHAEATTERQLDEIDEQIGHWSRVMNLVRFKEKIQPVQKKADNIDEDMSSGDENDFDEFLDWRAKDSFK